MKLNVRRIHKDFGHSEYPLTLEVINDSRRRLKFLFGGYVLMPDHGHALTWPVPPLPISDVLHDIKACPEPSEGKVSARRVHAALRTHGPFWQHEFWERFVRSAKEYRERLDYMHMNPVRKGLVKRPQDWRWSSYNNFSLDKAVVAARPIQID